MPANVLGKNIADALKSGLGGGDGYSAATPVTANSIIAQQITSYLLANAKIVTTYTGTIPGVPPVPEAGAGMHPVAGSVAPVPTASDYNSWLDLLGMNISIGFSTLPGVVIPKAPHVSFQVPNTKLSTFCPQASIKSLDNTKEGIHIQAWTKIAEGIFNMLTTQVSPPFAAGIAGMGVATVTMIQVV